MPWAWWPLRLQNLIRNPLCLSLQENDDLFQQLTSNKVVPRVLGRDFFFGLDYLLALPSKVVNLSWNTGNHIQMIRTLQALKHMDSISFHLINIMSCNSRISTLSWMASVLMLLYSVFSFYFNLSSVSNHQNCVWWVHCIIHCFMSNKQLFPVRPDSSYKYCMRTKQTLYLNHFNWAAYVSEKSINPDV